MRHCQEQLRINLENRFRKRIAVPYPVVGEKEYAAWLRLDNFCQAASIALPLLAEPWWKSMDSTDLKIFYLCADMHLYARVLDDAIDEGEPSQEKALLAMQDIYWAAASALSRARPGLSPMARQLIRETTEAACAMLEEPACWARKNHHLLLIPLFLSAKRSFFEKHRQSLSLAIGVLQAEDEMRQGNVKNIALLCSYIERAARIVPRLAAAGWPLLGERMIQGCRGMLASLGKLDKYGHVF